LAGFDYVALGHLHAPQEVAPRIRYSGSLLKYSFAEADHQKAAQLVEVERGSVRIESLPLGHRRDVVRLRGTLADLLSNRDFEGNRGDLVEATIDDVGYVLDARHRLQARFPHVLNVLRAELQTGGEGTFASRVAGAGTDDLALFSAFMASVAGTPPDDSQAACFAEAAEAVARKERSS
jgi:exonuclease SbcD